MWPGVTMEEQSSSSGAAPTPAPKSKALWIVVAVIVVVVVVLAAAVLGGLFTPAAKPALRIGTLLSITGALSQYGPGDTQGAYLAVHQINAAGGVLGQPIQLFTEDDQTDQTAAAAATTKLITQNHVNAIVGAQFSGGTIASIGIAKAAGVPMVSPSATSPALSNLTLTGGYFFRTAPSDALQGVVAANYLFNNLSYRYINLIGRDDSYGRGLVGVINTKFTALGGTVNTTVIINPKATQFSTDLATLFQKNPQAVYFAVFPGEGPTVLSNWKAGLSTNSGWDRPWVFSEGLDSQAFMDQLRDPSVGVDVTKIKGTSPVSPFGTIHDTFVTQYKAATTTTATPVLYTDYTYDAVYLIALAAQKAGSVDGNAIKANLPVIAKGSGTVIKPGQWSLALSTLNQSGGAVNWEGAAGSEDFDANGDVRGPYEVWGVNSSFGIYRIAFIPESSIQPAPPVTMSSQSFGAATPSTFSEKVQAAIVSRRF